MSIKPIVISREIRKQLTKKLHEQFVDYLGEDTPRTGKHWEMNPKRSAKAGEPPQFQLGELHKGIFTEPDKGVIGIKDNSKKLKELHFGFVNHKGEMSGGTGFIYSFFYNIDYAII